MCACMGPSVMYVSVFLAFVHSVVRVYHSQCKAKLIKQFSVDAMEIRKDRAWYCFTHRNIFFAIIGHLKMAFRAF